MKGDPWTPQQTQETQKTNGSSMSFMRHIKHNLTDIVFRTNMYEIISFTCSTSKMKKF